MDFKISRRRLLSYGIASLVGAIFGSFILKKRGIGEEKRIDLSLWPYKSVDPEKAKEIGYEGYFRWGCCYGVFISIMKQLAERYGSPYNNFPCQMMSYGKSGIAGFGSVCGAINGGALLMAIFTPLKINKKLIQSLFHWYEETPLPSYIPENPKASNIEIVKSRANSILCHISIAKWIEKSKFKISSKERKERCARLTADTSKKVVLILNNYFEKGKIPSFKMDSESKICLSCHGKKAFDDAKGKMSCLICHKDKIKDHPLKLY